MAAKPQRPDLTVGTYNVRCFNKGDNAKGDGWDARKGWLCSLIEFESPDLLGTQEVTYPQKLDMVAALPEYDCIGVGRDDGADSGEHMLIFYRRDRFKLLSHGTFWLSETPDKPTKGWDAACYRTCTWGCFRDRITHKKIWMFNLHNDHVGVVARRESAHLVMKKIGEMTGPNDRIFVTGDYNVDQNNEVYSIYTESLKDSYEVTQRRYAPNGSFNAFHTDAFTSSRIDHIFVSPAVTVLSYGILTETYRSEEASSGEEHKSANFPSELSYRKFTPRTPSDHFPVFIKVKL